MKGGIISVNQDRYNEISTWIRNKKYRYGIFTILYKAVPLLVTVTYGIMIVYAALYLKLNQCIRILVVPSVTFIIVTIFRKLIDEKRPYEVLDINPLVHKNKQGESFPSRHMVSVTIIAMAGLYINFILGIWLFALCMLVGILRPIAGVHYIKDILGAVCLAIVMGVIGFYML